MNIIKCIGLSPYLQCRKLGLLPPDESFPEQCRKTFQSLWANNGDAISRQYAGTVALKVSSFVSRSNWSSAYSYSLVSRIVRYHSVRMLHSWVARIFHSSRFSMPIYSRVCITRTAGDQKNVVVIRSFDVNDDYGWGNEWNVWECCTSYAIIRVITVRVMRSLYNFVGKCGRHAFVKFRRRFINVRSYYIGRR